VADEQSARSEIRRKRERHMGAALSQKDCGDTLLCGFGFRGLRGRVVERCPQAEDAEYSASGLDGLGRNQSAEMARQAFSCSVPNEPASGHVHGDGGGYERSRIKLTTTDLGVERHHGADRSGGRAPARRMTLFASGSVLPVPSAGARPRTMRRCEGASTANGSLRVIPSGSL